MTREPRNAHRRSRRGQRGFFEVIFGLVLLSGVFALSTYMDLSTLQTARMTSTSRARAVAVRANESAVELIMRLLESETIKVDWTQTGQDALPAGPITGTNWLYQKVGTPAVATLTMDSCDARSVPLTGLQSLDDLYRNGALPTCTVMLTTTLTFDVVDVANDFALVKALTPVTIDQKQAPVGLSLRAKVHLPNRCNGEDANGYLMTKSKRPRMIYGADDWRRMTDGEHYVLAADINVSTLTAPVRPLKNVYIDGKFHSVLQFNYSSAGSEDVGHLRDISCGTIRDIALEQSSGDMVGGSRCIGGLVGIIRRSLVQGVSFTGKVQGSNGVGGIVGCIDNPTFWRSRVTEVFANSVIEAIGGVPGECTTSMSDGTGVVNPAPANNICCPVGSSACHVGGAVGINRGILSDGYTVGEIVDFLVSVAPYAFGGLVGLHDSTAALTTANEPALIDHSFSSMNITLDGNTTVGTGVGGLVGVALGSIAIPVQITDSSAHGNIVADFGMGANKVGGLVGEITNGRIDHAFVESRDVPGSSPVVKSGEVKGKDKVGGLIGEANNTTVLQSFVQLAGQPPVTGTNEVGGFAGSATNSTFGTSFSATQVTGSSVVGGFLGTSAGNSFQPGTYANGNTNLFDQTLAPIANCGSGCGGEPHASTTALMTGTPSWDPAFSTPEWTTAPDPVVLTAGQYPDAAPVNQVPVINTTCAESSQLGSGNTACGQ